MMLSIVIHTFRAKTLEKGKCVCSRKKKGTGGSFSDFQNLEKLKERV